MSMQMEGKSREELLHIIAMMQQSQQRKLTLKVTSPKLDEKTGEMKGTSGAISLYGLGRFPITLYRGQWERLIGEVEHIKAFIEANAGLLAVKE